MKSRGLGDTLKKVFDKTGVTKITKAIAGDDCGCESRQEFFNGILPYNKK